MTSRKTIEHRTEPRFRRHLHVRIGSLELATANVSLHGMQIVCPIMRYKSIEPDVKRGQLSAQITLPRDAVVGATLSVRYHSRYGDEVLIGTRIDSTEPDAHAQWTGYILELSGAT